MHAPENALVLQWKFCAKLFRQLWFNTLMGKFFFRANLITNIYYGSFWMHFILCLVGYTRGGWGYTTRLRVYMCCAHFFSNFLSICVSFENHDDRLKIQNGRPEKIRFWTYFSNILLRNSVQIDGQLF